MTDIATREVYRGTADSRSWIAADQSGPTGRLSSTLDISTFTKATHYPKGYIPSGVPLGKITATGKFGPYDNTASDGRATAVGFLWNSVDIYDGKVSDFVAYWYGVGAILTAKLPVAIDDAGKADLAAWFKFV